MTNRIEELVKSGNLSEAVEMLLDFAKGVGAGKETQTDIVALSQRISDLERLQKRKKISTEDAIDKKVELTYDLLDVIASLPAGGTQGAATPATATMPDTGATAPAATPAPAINNKINININIENIVTTEIKNQLRDVRGGFDELKSELKQAGDDDSQKAVEEIEALEQDLQSMENASSKEQLPPYLEKVQSFFKRLEDGNDHLSKAIKTAKNGAAVAQKLARNYNSVARWVGLPQVPPILTGE